MGANGGNAVAVDVVARARAGDAGAFVMLYRSHAPLVRHVLRDRVADSDQVEDLVQEVFTRALEAFPSLRDTDRFAPWLLAITRHAAIDNQRARQRGPLFVDGDTIDLPALQPGPEERAELAELAELVRTCVVGMSARDAAAVMMVTYLGLTPAEVAASLGLTYGAAKVVMHRARARLRRALMLQLLVRQAFPSCVAFGALVDAGDLTKAARHADDCGSCRGAVSDYLAGAGASH